MSAMRPVLVVRPARATDEKWTVASVRHSWGKEFDAGFPTELSTIPNFGVGCVTLHLLSGPVQTETAFRITLWPSTLMRRSKPLGKTSLSLTVCGSSQRLA